MTLTVPQFEGIIPIQHFVGRMDIARTLMRNTFLKSVLQYWIGGWVGLRAGLNAVEKRKIPSLLRRESNPRTP
jgi:hypothetical protein